MHFSVRGTLTEKRLQETLGAEDLYPDEVLDRIDKLVLHGTGMRSEESRWRAPYLHTVNRRTGRQGHPADRRRA
ncbi:hypothetical protein ACQEVG_18770 [Streptomyces sp. CA-135486]|uniref:hypothetical protein n=1 Tax=Streptomyces sp. CA-135486 TaxID=3240049 RepID=UPI003D8F3730